MEKFGKRLIKSAKTARKIARGEARPGTYRVHIPAEIDVAVVRKNLNLSQPDFAARYGFTVDAIRSYEQGRTNPTGPVRAYLKVIEKNPKAVEKALEDA